MPKLRIVGPEEAAVPTTMVEASEGSRRQFLVMSRKQIASVIDAGVPAHALGRLIAEAERLDAEIRRLDASEDQEAVSSAEVANAAFGSRAI